MSAEAPAHDAAVPQGRFAPVAQPEGRPRPHPVMLLQGIVRSRLSLHRMARGLAAAGFEVYNLGGPSPRLPLEMQVARFRRDLERLGRELSQLHNGEPPLMHGVGHSMGGIVLRVALAQADGVVSGRVVAIATPFLGTRVADVVCKHRIARLVLGAALRDLSWHSAAIRRLAASVGEQPAVGIILGQRGFQPLLPAAWINAWLGVKDTDGTIQPASARGDGLWPPPADVLEVRTGHTFMAEKPDVIRQTAHFLAHGCFCR
jgi:pimeloyl-ACP methyl ester carboxylesterase